MNKKTKQYGKWFLYLLGLAVIVAGYKLLPVDDWIESFRSWVENLGAIGWIITIFGYAIATLLLVPGALLTIACGVAFGLWGFLIVLAGATLGAATAFVASRYMFQEKIKQKIESNKKFKAVLQSINDEGWKVVGLMRLSPAVPFSIQNWFFGATSVGFWPYILTTCIGIMPGTLLYVWIGSIGGSAASDGSTSIAKYILFGVGLLATLVVTVIVSRKAKAKLQDHGIDE